MNNFPPPPPKKGLSTGAKFGIGCLGVIVIFAALIAAVLIKFAPDLRDYASEAQKNPVRAAANLAAKLNHDIEILEVDEVKKTIKVRNRSSGEIVKMNLDDLQRGKFTGRDESGDEVNVNSTGDGTPTWIPAYPGTKILPGGTKMERQDKIYGVAKLSSADDVLKIKDFYTIKLTAAGFKIDVPVATAVAEQIIATNSATKQRITIVIQKGEPNSEIMLTYEASK